MCWVVVFCKACGDEDVDKLIISADPMILVLTVCFHSSMSLYTTFKFASDKVTSRQL